MHGGERRTRRSRPTVRTDGHVQVPQPDTAHQDIDAEMLDGDVEEGEGEGESLNHDRHVPGFVSRSGFALAMAGNSSGARDDVSEGDGSPSASAEGVVMGHELSLDTEPVISGKRKR